VPVKEVVDALAEEYEVRREVGRQVLGWFGQIMGGVGEGEMERWEMDVEGVVREVGLGILRNYKVRFRCVCCERALWIINFWLLCRTTR
jgi:sister chromatid cohesion protein DCC1